MEKIKKKFKKFILFLDIISDSAEKNDNKLLIFCPIILMKRKFVIH
jgi:hypothetical protein